MVLVCTKKLARVSQSATEFPFIKLRVVNTVRCWRHEGDHHRKGAEGHENQDQRKSLLLQLRVFSFGLLINGDVGVGAFPEGEEVLISRLRLGGVPRDNVGSR